MNAATRRETSWQMLQDQEYDVVVVGAGVSGAALYRQLSMQGYRSLLIDRGDYASGTSQASGMLIWGGLLYLKNFDLRTVVELSRARDDLIRRMPHTVRPATFRYLSRLSGARPGWLVRAALEAYWWLGGCRRRRPRRERYFETRKLLADNRFGDSLTYEEGFLPMSDARLVLRWIEEGCLAAPGSLALNYCSLEQAEFCGSFWQLQLEDRWPRYSSSPSAQDSEAPRPAQTIRTRYLVNATGVWADELNQRLGLQSEHRHVFSKGVYLALPRPTNLNEFLAFEMGAHGDTLTYTPWGPVALWGPTETPIPNLDNAFSPNADDLGFLLETARANLKHQFMPQDIVSLRGGVRPLAVKKSYAGKDYPLDLSRRCVVDVDPNKSGLTLYGGKLTSAPKMAKQAAAAITQTLGTRAEVAGERIGLVDHVCLYDYVRRRTNIAQWTPRLGLGAHNEYRDFVLQLASRFHDSHGAEAAVQDLESRAQAQDNLLKQLH